MKSIIFYPIFLFTCFACNERDNRDSHGDKSPQQQTTFDKEKYHDLRIIIEDPTYKINIFNKTYTVFFFDPSKSIQRKFSLSQKEDSLLSYSLFHFRLDTVTQSLNLSCSGADLTEIKTTLIIEGKKYKVKLIINQFCNYLDKSIGNNINQFLNEAKAIIQSKKEIQELPESDIRFI